MTKGRRLKFNSYITCISYNAQKTTVILITPPQGQTDQALHQQAERWVDARVKQR
jgi:hypothetical protein